MVVFGRGDFIWAKVVVIGQSGCIRAKCLYLGKVVVFGESCCIWAKVVVFRQTSCF